ncbi:hypothetical protein, partial [Salinarimonas rosea]|uniref:hypothetical protein n=1 Tax=Salinarimonas rosea TaxID=552063 RepID=UPI001AEBF3F4
MRRSIPLLAFAFTALAPLPASAQETPDLCMGYIEGGRYSSCRLVLRPSGEPRCLCRLVPLQDVLTTGSIRRAPVPEAGTFRDSIYDQTEDAAPGGGFAGGNIGGGPGTGNGSGSGSGSGGGGGNGGGGNGGG